MRPSVTSATPEAAILQHAERRRQLVQLRHAVGLRALEAHDGDEVAVELAGLEAVVQPLLAVEDRAGASMTRRSGFTAEILMTARPRLPRSSFRPPVGWNGFSTGASTFASPLFARRRLAHDGAVVAEPGLDRVGRSPSPQTVCTSSCRMPVVEQLADQEAHAAGGVEMVHVGNAVRIDARQQRHDFATDRKCPAR